MSKLFGLGEAILYLEEGKKVCRTGWNGKGMWIALMEGMCLPAEKVNERTKKHIGPGTGLDCQPYIAMWTADQKWQPGWLASQPDLLAKDWQLVD